VERRTLLTAASVGPLVGARSGPCSWNLRGVPKRIECPMLHLWAKGGPLDTFYTKDGGSLGIWRQWAPRVEGQAMKGGHFFPEENPDDTAALVNKFLAA
jgi:pimeloyl-ACP methyl ester carboxylesterase